MAAAVMLGLVCTLRIEIQNESVSFFLSLSLSLSLSPIRRHDHLSDMCLAYLIARVRPSLSLVPHAIAVTVAAVVGAAFYARALASEGGLARWKMNAWLVGIAQPPRPDGDVGTPRHSDEAPTLKGCNSRFRWSRNLWKENRDS